MTTEQRELLRTRLLTALAPNETQYGLPSRLLLAIARAEAWRDLELAGLEVEMDYLEQKFLVRRVGKVLSPENRVWQITAAGRDFLAEQGIA